MGDRDIYLRWRGQVTGPFSMDQVRSMLDGRRITRHCQVSDDRVTWRPIAKDDRFGAQRPMPAPIVLPASPAAVSAAERPAPAEQSRQRSRLRVSGETAEAPGAEHAARGAWYYCQEEIVRGPVPTSSLQAMLSNGMLTRESLVCRDGERAWRAMDTVSEIFGPTLATAAVTGAASAPEWAGFWLRFFAFLLDALILGALNAGLGFVLGLVFGLTGRADSPEKMGILSGFAGLLGGIVQWLYFTCMECSARRGTLGKTALGIAVVDEQGRMISFGRANARYWGKLLSALTLMVGFLLAGFTQKKQALHDMLAGTLVIRVRSG